MTDETEVPKLDPAEVHSERPKGPKREAGLRSVYEKFPGHISMASDRANFSGCRFVEFRPEGPYGLEKEDEEAYFEDEAVDEFEFAVQHANAYFARRANLLCLERTPVGNGGILCTITTQLDSEDLEEFQEVSRRVQLEMQPWREARAQAREIDNKVRLENARLLEVGRKAETYNLFEKLRKYEAGEKP